MGKMPAAARGLIGGIALLAAGPAAAEVTIAVNQGRVDLDARSAPLSDVLDRLARQTAMQVTYDGAPPRNLVTATVAAATQAQAVLSVLEGLGVNYAIQLDRTGSEVRTLLLIAARTGSAAPRPGAAAGPVEPTPRMPPPPPQADDDDEPLADDDEPPMEVRPDRPERMRPGRERPDRPGVFQPGAPSTAVPFPTPAPIPAYPVSPFAPVVPPPIQMAPPPPQQPPPADPDSDGF
jgi:hypothetical protein